MECRKIYSALYQPDSYKRSAVQNSRQSFPSATFKFFPISTLPRTCSKVTSYVMADLKFYNYPGVGEQNKTDAWYSQAVRIGDRIECSGQGKLSSRASCSRYPRSSIYCSYF